MMQPTRVNEQIRSTKGSFYGHLFRRLVHVSMAVLPFPYYLYIVKHSPYIHLSIHSWLWIILALIIVTEVLRMALGLQIFGQRQYEARKLSAFAWGAVAIVLVFQGAPGIGYAVPLIWSLALVDPLLGELRRLFVARWVYFIGFLTVLIIWWIASLWFGIAWWWGLLLAPITVAAEVIKLKWIDDNALMLLIPLLVILAVRAIMY